MNGKTQIFRFVRKEEVPAFIEAGWTKHRSLEGTHHGRWSDLIEWEKEGPPVTPTAEIIPIAG